MTLNIVSLLGLLSILVLFLTEDSSTVEAFFISARKPFQSTPGLFSLQQLKPKRRRQEDDDCRIITTTMASKVGDNDDVDKKQEIGQMYGGLVFLKTNDRKSMVEFYKNRIGMTDWLEQPNITILQHGNMILGFHQKKEQEEVETAGMYTFVYPSKQQVDQMYTCIEDIADAPPRVNETYQIYQFFAKDPEGRNLEFQAFLHPLFTVTSQPSS